MIVEVQIPQVGESITEGFIVEWFKKDGEVVQEEDELFELETDKVTMAIESTTSGKLQIKVAAGSKVDIGQVVGSIDTDFVIAESSEPTVESETAPAISTPAGTAQLKEKLSPDYDKDNLSPAVRRMVEELNIDPTDVKGTGKDGRITKGDLIQFTEDQSEPTEASIQNIVSPKVIRPASSQPPVINMTERQTRKPMTMLRQRIAERLVLAQQNAAILTTFNEVDMTNLMNLRSKYKVEFEKTHGIKLGIMSFFVKASIEALKTVPQAAAQIDGDQMVYNNYFDIGVAVSSDRGLVVPVIRDPDLMSFAQIEASIADLAQRAKNKKLLLDDLTGGVFTISNGGIFGSLLSTPILNPPQSAILGLHGIKKRPMVVGEDDRIEARPMMYLALSYDHRVIDGAEAVTFLKKIVSCIENPERIMFEI